MPKVLAETSNDASDSRFAQLRREYHTWLAAQLLSRRKGSDVPNIADKGSKASIALAKGIVERIGLPLASKKLSPQTIGQRFSELTAKYLDAAFRLLGHIRPGEWIVSTAQSGTGIAAFDQYEHIAQLQEVLGDRPELKAALGGDYLITPDITLGRMPVEDSELNKNDWLISPKDAVAQHAPLRKANLRTQQPILHASVSCKWTMRSDRAQNTRTEALNLIRNRKGNTPHIVAVTFEPLPARIASLAMGTGDLDCVYHVALRELRETAIASRYEDASELLDTLVNGRRLRDISDLVLDLAV